MKNKFHRLEAYKIVNDRLNKEIDEYYQVNNIFTALQSIALFGYINFISSWFSPIILATMLALCLIWAKLNYKSYEWRNHWLREAKKFGKEGVLGKIRLWIGTEKVRQDIKGVWRLIDVLPKVFFTVWIIFTIYSFIKFGIVLNERHYF